MIRLNKRIRKEKKIFDPSDTDSPSTKKRKKSSSQMNTSRKEITNPSRIHLRELSIKLERLKPEEIEKYLKLEGRDSEPVEDTVTVEELLSDEDKCLVQGVSSSPPVKVFECPFCPRERTTLHRLRLHICSEHDYHQRKLMCPICKRRMMGWIYEIHVLKEHAPLLEDKNYLFNPGVLSKKDNHEKIDQQPEPDTDSENYSIKFNGENPWEDILSPSSRKKRTMDMVSVMSIMRSTKTESYSYQGETSPSSKVFWNFNNKKHFLSLQNKVTFTCSLDLNSFYKEYLDQLKRLKMKKILLSKYSAKLNEIQIEKIRREIEISEDHLNKFQFEQKHDKNEILNTAVEVKEKIFQNRDNKKKLEIMENENQIVHNLVRKGIIGVGGNSTSLLSKRRIITFNKKTGEISNILSRNGEVPLNSTVNSMPVTELRDPLALSDEKKIENNRITYQSLDPKSVIALNIPMHEILENNLSVDLKSEF